MPFLPLAFCILILVAGLIIRHRKKLNIDANEDFHFFGYGSLMFLETSAYAVYIKYEEYWFFLIQILFLYFSRKVLKTTMSSALIFQNPCWCTNTITWSIPWFLRPLWPNIDLRKALSNSISTIHIQIHNAEIKIYLLCIFYVPDEMCHCFV